MKRILFVTAILMLIFSISASAITLAEHNLSIDIDGQYSVLTRETLGSNEELVSSLGHSLTSIRQYFDDNSLILFAVNADNTRQLQVICKETEFSKRLGDMSYLSDNDALSFVNRFVTVKTVSDLTLLTIGDTKYYEIVSSGTDSGGEFCSVQYVTVRGGKLYTFSFLGNGGTNNEDFKKFASNTIATAVIGGGERSTVADAENITEMVIIFLLIAAAAVVAGWLLVTLVRDMYRKSEDGFKISRRKHK